MYQSMLTKLCIFISLCALSPFGHASVSDQEFAELKSNLLALSARVSMLEAENTALKADSPKALITSTNHAPKKIIETLSQKPKENIKWKGDFRYRYEGIQVENKDDRSRNRIRARIALIAQLKDNVEVGFGLASGGDDPVSTNQSLGDAASSKDARLDLAYFKWQANPNLTVVAGKFKNIWVRPDKNELVWDSDYNPEGFGLTYKANKLFINTALNWLQSDSKKANTRFSWGLQAGIATKIGGGKLTSGIAYYDIPVEKRGVFIGDADEFSGNSFTCVDPTALVDCTYSNNFEEVQVFAEYKTKLNGMPLTLFGDYVKNLAADKFDTAWATGIKLGKASGRGTWDMAYRYQSLEADSLFGLTTNSDFGGGGTDSLGHVIKGSFAMNKQWKLGFTYLDTKRNGDLGSEEDYQRIQIDTKFKF